MTASTGTYQYFYLSKGIPVQKEQTTKKNVSDYFSFGMPMPNRQIVNGEPYRYAYQGQEKDPETGKEAFQLRLWDSRIGRWLNTDPAGQHASPYLGMSNNSIVRVDPDGGWDWVKGEDGIYWDPNATNQQTTKAGETYIGASLSDVKSYLNDNLKGLDWFKFKIGITNVLSYIDANSYYQAKGPGLVDNIFKAKRDLSLSPTKKIERKTDMYTSQDLDDYEPKSFEVIGGFNMINSGGSFNYTIQIGGEVIFAEAAIFGAQYNAANKTFNKISYGLSEHRSVLNGVDKGTLMLGHSNYSSNIIRIQFKTLEDIHLVRDFLNGRSLINISPSLKN
ncbi:MAG: hypothetical protein GKR88_15120 [Flavobacteriaceae bacterium]|nr:MAG: hypothetical protein GKR88_15120 [Flavobacteriaceae bacterium]